MYADISLPYSTPPDVVLFSYIRGLFVYCPFFWGCSHDRTGIFIVQALLVWRHEIRVVVCPPPQPGGGDKAPKVTEHARDNSSRFCVFFGVALCS